MMGPEESQNWPNRAESISCRSENSGRSRAGRKEGIIGNHAAAPWLFPSPAEFRGFYCPDRDLGAVSQLLAAIAAEHDGTDEAKPDDAAATAARAAGADSLSALRGGSAGGVFVLSALRIGIE